MSKIDDLRLKYSKVHTRTFNTLKDADFTKTKKYLERMLKYSLDTIPTGYLKNIPEEFEKYSKYLEIKDIYNPVYDDYYDLVQTLKDAEKVKLEKSFKREGNVVVLYEDDNFLLVRPITINGSQRYGYGTKWCTTQQSVFDDYSSSGELFYLMVKKSDVKFAFFYTDPFKGVEMFDQNDSRLEIVDMVNDLTFDEIKTMCKLMEDYVIDRYEEKMVNKEKEKLRKVLKKLSRNLITIDDINEVVKEVWV